MKTKAVVALGVAAGVILGSVTAALGAAGPFGTRVLTADGGDTYVNLSSVRTNLVVVAPGTNSGSNTRVTYWHSSTPIAAGGISCATWDSFPVTAQPGLAHNISPAGGLTVTRNVWGGAYWVFNVHTWLPNGTGGYAFTQVAQMDWGTVIGAGTPETLPWRVCSWLSGTSLRVKLWFPSSEPEPSWADPDRTRSATVPSTAPGRGGWYVGHLPPGGAMVMTALS